ncbi:porin [Candidatus Pelagibacter ubique]|nr:porin [Candidatus Pelagibacter ubique]
MNNLKKIGLSALAGSLAAVSVNAAELSVSGGAALYVGTTNENGAGYYSMGDSVTFSGSGETDGGLNIAVSFELDGNDPAGATTSVATAAAPAGSNVLDNRSVAISTEAMGTITWSGHGGDSVVSGWDDMTPTAYEEVWDLTAGADTNRIAGASGNNMIRYDSPSFSGVSVHASYVNAAAGGVSMYSDFGIKISPEMVEGLTVGFATGEVEETAGVFIDESVAFITYAYGPVTIGYQESEADGPTATEDDDSTSMSISYQISDDFSVSYGTHELDLGSATAAGTDQESSGWSASYTMGGMSISGHMHETDNVAGDATADLKSYELELAFAF